MSAAPSGPYAALAGKVRQKRETSGLAAKLLQLQKTLRQQAEELSPVTPKKHLVGLLYDASEEAGRLAKDLGR